MIGGNVCYKERRIARAQEGGRIAVNSYHRSNPDPIRSTDSINLNFLKPSSTLGIFLFSTFSAFIGHSDGLFGLLAFPFMPSTPSECGITRFGFRLYTVANFLAKISLLT